MLLLEAKWLCSLEYLLQIEKYAKGVSAEQSELILEGIKNGEILARPALFGQGAQTGVEHIYVYGPLVLRPDPIAILFGRGYTTYQSLQERAEELQNNAEIDTVVMHINSPGGVVEGVDDTWAALRALEKKKRLIALNEGMMDSAAYWLASAAKEIYATNETVEQGSIGIVARIDRYQGASTEIVTSQFAKYKNSAQEGFSAQIQKLLNDIEAVFIGRIAEGRKMSAAKIQETFGQGASISTKAALAVGMIDGVKTLQSIYNDRDSASKKRANSDNNNNNVAPQSAQKGQTVDFKEMLENPSVVAEIAKRVEAAREEGKQAHVAVVTRALALTQAGKYGEEISALAFDVCKGAQTIAVLEAVVALEDRRAAKAEVQHAVQDQPTEPIPAIMPVIAKQERTAAEIEAALRKELGR